MSIASAAAGSLVRALWTAALLKEDEKSGRGDGAQVVSGTLSDGERLAPNSLTLPNAFATPHDASGLRRRPVGRARYPHDRSVRVVRRIGVASHRTKSRNGSDAMARALRSENVASSACERDVKVMSESTFVVVLDVRCGRHTGEDSIAADRRSARTVAQPATPSHPTEQNRVGGSPLATPAAPSRSPGRTAGGRTRIGPRTYLGPSPEPPAQS